MKRAVCHWWCLLALVAARARSVTLSDAGALNRSPRRPLSSSSRSGRTISTDERLDPRLGHLVTVDARIPLGLARASIRSATERAGSRGRGRARAAFAAAADPRVRLSHLVSHWEPKSGIRLRLAARSAGIAVDDKRPPCGWAGGLPASSRRARRERGPLRRPGAPPLAAGRSQRRPVTPLAADRTLRRAGRGSRSRDG